MQLATYPLPLTAREREIANLAAAGLSNREIADRLVVSVRTVEGHLYRACVKLGISDREQLATMIRSGHAVAGHTMSGAGTPSQSGSAHSTSLGMAFRV